ncbi:hypothetical protein CLP_2036 [Clostridium butyricum E4 str. BoNT E BL5262]|uniref:Uncharacterized protein n=1 Tax=Clostridium butyricum E4 str. BoNT E BL5262 TaxID=632245 RepID=C4IGM9_CLOBU|nr:hypothetical protein CLP_2036 [Clostridium butyricum E4 str. BoNT E BL5262]EMU54655.1 hypothetical protein CBDKU1_14690 [Clostridium butyricum DKU-01]
MLAYRLDKVLNAGFTYEKEYGNEGSYFSEQFRFLFWS